MNIDPVDFGVFMIIMLVVIGVLYVAFGETTVRKLRKNDETKDALGMEFVSGRDIMNVAMALSIPRWINRKAQTSRVSFMFADAEVLYKYTTVFDRVFARIFYWTFVLTTSIIIIYVTLIYKS